MNEEKIDMELFDNKKERQGKRSCKKKRKERLRKKRDWKFIEKRKYGREENFKN